MSGLLKVLAVTTAAAGVACAVSEDVQFQAVSMLGTPLRQLDPETSHRIGILAAAYGLFPRTRKADDARLQVTALGRTFSNPIGLAAGFDKDAEAIDALLGIGLGFMEVGSITPEAQPGNPKPRAFRLLEHGAVINRYGFNSRGADNAAVRLQIYQERRSAGFADAHKVLAVNLGKNKLTENAADDYCIGIEKLSPFADIVVVNISSPNTPGLRSLQGKAALDTLVVAVQGAMDKVEYPAGRPALLVKIAPDLTAADKDDIAAVMLHRKVDGLVVGNTTISRPGGPSSGSASPKYTAGSMLDVGPGLIAEHEHGAEAGGLSGAPLFELSTQALRDMYSRTEGKVTLIGCGGVSTGRDAYAKIRAGATLVELYTGLAYKGPGVVSSIKAELLECLAEDGFSCVEDAIAADHRKVLQTE